MMSMARGGWSVQLGSTDRLDPLFMLSAGVPREEQLPVDAVKSPHSSAESSRLTLALIPASPPL